MFVFTDFCTETFITFYNQNGSIFISTVALEGAFTDDELAFTLSHEIAHSVLGHGVSLNIYFKKKLVIIYIFNYIEGDGQLLPLIEICWIAYLCNSLGNSSVQFDYNNCLHIRLLLFGRGD